MAVQLGEQPLHERSLAWGARYVGDHLDGAL
jgi:hypothetical protein